ncbi:hypothetical protein EYC84_011956 [Monilinia fructicola]|uniref:Uncharacterized protein n=1 Tax=Monilinia fructicola TaxID=38448 RepID=A0A5M9J6U3_MONFR|nr:hypothetical protein EYC84_011956 [Monilinia fructicola]
MHLSTTEATPNNSTRNTTPLLDRETLCERRFHSSTCATDLSAPSSAPIFEPGETGRVYSVRTTPEPQTSPSKDPSHEPKNRSHRRPTDFPPPASPPHHPPLDLANLTCCEKRHDSQTSTSPFVYNPRNQCKHHTCVRMFGSAPVRKNQDTVNGHNQRSIDENHIAS